MTRKQALAAAQRAIGHVHRVTSDGWGYTYPDVRDPRMLRVSAPRAHAHAVQARAEHVAAEAAMRMGCSWDDADWFSQCATHAPRAAGKLAYILRAIGG